MARMPPKKRQKEQQQQQDGSVAAASSCLPRRPWPPRRAEDLLTGARRFVEVLPGEAQAAISSLLCESEVHAGTHYSGMGCWEIALSNALESVGGDVGNVDVFHSCDVEAHCFAVIQSHRPGTRPRHLFNSEEARWSDEALIKMKNIEKKYSRQVLTNPGRASELGETMQREMAAVLAQEVLLKEAYCIIHQQNCPIFDVDLPTVRATKGLVISMASPVSVDHSAMKKGAKGLAGDTALAFQCYLGERRWRFNRQEEDFAFLGITPAHLPEQLWRRTYIGT